MKTIFSYYSIRFLRGFQLVSRCDYYATEFLNHLMLTRDQLTNQHSGMLSIAGIFYSWLLSDKEIIKMKTALNTYLRTFLTHPG